MVYVKLAAKTMITSQRVKHEQVSSVVLAPTRLEHDPLDFPRIQFEAQPLKAVASPPFGSVSRSSSTNDDQILNRDRLHGLTHRVTPPVRLCPPMQLPLTSEPQGQCRIPNAVEVVSSA
jgi:hypothetical protein